MTDFHSETPVFESRNTALQKNHSKLAYLLVGVGAFVLLAQVVPGYLFFPLLLLAVGAYFLRKDRTGLYFIGRGRSFTRGHALVSLGAFFLLSQFVPGSFLVPLTLIAIGYILLRQRDQRTTF